MSKFRIPIILFWGCVLGVMLIKLDTYPHIWWDEGWTLDVARNWAENGHFGHYLNGVEIPPRIPVRFPVVLPIALSFKLIGIGIWQGRLPGVIFTLLTLLLLFYLVAQLYNYRIAYATILILAIMSVPELNPIYIGRQVLAEMPMLFYLIGGYIFCWLALTKSSRYFFPASILWGISLISKFQVLPFWLCSVILMLLFTIFLRNWRVVTLIGITFVGTIIVAFSISQIQKLVMPSSFEDKPVWDLLINSIIFVFDWPIRLNSLVLISFLGVPSIIGFSYAATQIITFIRHAGQPNTTNKFRLTNPFKNIYRSSSITLVSRQIMIIGIWGLGTSWFVWYSFFGMSWPRYLFPAYFFGSIFVAVFLDNATNGFKVSSTILNASAMILKKTFSIEAGKAMAAVFIIGVNLSLSLLQNYYLLIHQPGSLDPIVELITNQIPDDELIETFESELYFVAPHKYHFPSDLVSMQLVRKQEIDPTQKIDYDPLKSNPEYLVIGNYARDWKLYTGILNNGSFSLFADLPTYQIYRRVRN